MTRDRACFRICESILMWQFKTNAKGKNISRRPGSTRWERRGPLQFDFWDESGLLMDAIGSRDGHTFLLSVQNGRYNAVIEDDKGNVVSTAAKIDADEVIFETVCKYLKIEVVEHEPTNQAI